MDETLPLEQVASVGQSSPQPAARSSKAVSFHPSATCQGSRNLFSKNFSNLSESVWESRESNSGYTQEKQADFDEGIRRGYYQRLYRFYEHYNPQKLSRVEEYLDAYRGEEEQLFAILTGKYGPEPADTTSKSVGSTFSSENASVMHCVGKRYKFPASVSPEQGNTDYETPYWGNSNLVSERDILSLLCNLETQNVELQKCYVGLLAQHPSSSWNGITYTTRAEGVAPGGTEFLGHFWAGSLASKKAMVCEGTVYHRVVLYCTDECQRCGHHERWRLSIYSSEVNSLYLIRVMWDPVVSLEPLPVSRLSLSSHPSSEPALVLGSSASCGRYRNESGFQPEQPPVATTLANILAAVERLETKLCGRLDALESRFSILESKLSRMDCGASNDTTN
ncbi:hypothetical protein DQ04_04041070 [Trypanosoma grayi]|uniref:hypothetical protein n=1 Tax=Trypanosoma grayi TaxID=71804 RepID=UPI0004F484D0|nr:hypothetical protein DQ04_04041070 [Trypanosoma grayi]KEG10215.1 hypothetical protein DQ04_04041070 [Trypanosoma grayi]